MQELVGKNLNNIVGNLWQRQETEGSGSSHGNIVSIISQTCIVFTLETIECIYVNNQLATIKYSNVQTITDVRFINCLHI